MQLVVWSWIVGALVLLNAACLSRLEACAFYVVAQGSKKEKVETSKPF